MAHIQDWQRANASTFWKQEATCTHVLQLYKNEEELLNLLEGFATSGIMANDCVVLIATKAHLANLELRMSLHGLNVNALRASKQYVPLDATEILASIMVNDWPDYTLFVNVITTIFDDVRDAKRPVRAFGEMVALLWEQGNEAATVMLEHFWNAFFEKEDFTLFCAYPVSDFKDDAISTLSTICKAHTKLVTTAGNSITEIAYQNTSI